MVFTKRTSSRNNLVTDIKKERARGRPRCFDRSAAINTALSLFRQKGYDGVAVAELSQALRIKPPSLYAAFGNKHGLFVEAVKAYAAEEGTFIREAVDKATSLEEAVTNLLLTAAEAFCKCKNEPGCLILDGTRNCTESKAQATTEKMRQEIKAFLEEAFSRHSAHDTGEMADYVLIAMTGLSGAARQGEKREVLVGAARRFAAAILQDERS
jgi:TetR/AcrR family transcriptional repressor for divergent bdcA